MGDLAKTSANFFERMRNSPPPGGSVSTGTKPTPGIWARMLNALDVEGQGQAVEPPANVPDPQPTPVDPYVNYARKATGQPYK